MKKVCGRQNVSAEWKIKPASAELAEEVENLKVMVQRLRKQVRELQDFKTATDGVKSSPETHKDVFFNNSLLFILYYKFPFFSSFIA